MTKLFLDDKFLARIGFVYDTLNNAKSIFVDTKLT